MQIKFEILKHLGIATKNLIITTSFLHPVRNKQLLLIFVTLALLPLRSYAQLAPIFIPVELMEIMAKEWEEYHIRLTYDPIFRITRQDPTLPGALKYLYEFPEGISGFDDYSIYWHTGGGQSERMVTSNRPRIDWGSGGSPDGRSPYVSTTTSWPYVMKSNRTDRYVLIFGGNGTGVAGIHEINTGVMSEFELTLPKVLLPDPNKYARLGYKGINGPVTPIDAKACAYASVPVPVEKASKVATSAPAVVQSKPSSAKVAASAPANRSFVLRNRLPSLRRSELIAGFSAENDTNWGTSVVCHKIRHGCETR